MSERSTATTKRILLTENDSAITHHLVGLLSKYGDSVQTVQAEDAGQVLAELRAQENESRFAALVLDLMLPYGSAHEEIEGDTDPDQKDTGLRLLKLLRDAEREQGLDRMWVAIITARSPFAVGPRAEVLLAGYGAVYYKPLNTLQLEDDLMRAIGVKSRVPPELLAASTKLDLGETGP